MVDMAIHQIMPAAIRYTKDLCDAMNAIRSAADMLETLTDKSYWLYPTYSDLLFY